MTYDLDKLEYNKLQQMQRDPDLSRRRYRKVTVLVMLHQDYKIEAVEAALGLDDNTIRRYWSGYKEEGLEVYLSDNYVPYAGKLTDEEETELVSHLVEHLYLDVKPIIDYVHDKYGITYTVSGMRDLLHRLGFVYKQTKAVPSKADEEAQKRFLEERFPELLAEVKAGNAELYFSDGTHPTHNTKTGRGWILKGTEFPVDCNSGRQRLNINGAVRATKPEHIVYDEAKTINAQSTKRLCQKLLKKHPKKKIFLVCDNAGYNRCKWLLEWAQDQRIEFVFLPAYSPNLNLIERLWRLLRKEAINSMYYESFQEFKQAILDFLDKPKLYKTELRSLLTLNFRTVGNSSYYFSQTTS